MKKSRVDASGGDGGWSLRYSPAQAGIPDYDSSTDKNVPLAKTERFRKHLREIRKAAQAEGAGGSGKYLRSRSAGGGSSNSNSLKELSNLHPPGSMRPMDSLLLAEESGPGGRSSKGQLLANPSKGPQAQHTPSGGMTIAPDPKLTYGRDDTVAPEQELEVLKAILLREGYLHRIAETAASKEALKTVPTALPDLLDLCRIATVEVVEAIAKWRQAQPGKSTLPFDWNGINYLLKIPSDLDFLAENRPLVAWLGFEVTRNPFVVPLPLEHGAKQALKASRKAERQNNSKSGSGVEGFTPLGTAGNVTVKYQGSNSDDQQANITTPVKGGSKLLGNNSSSVGAPYSMAVVNDQTVAPSVAGGAKTGINASPGGTQPPTTDGTGGNDTPSKGGVGFTVSSRASHPSKELSASQVGDGDLKRVRSAEALILSEEQRKGVWRRAPDGSGRLVPASAADAQRFLQGLAVDDHRPAVDPAHGPGHLAPFAESGGMGLAKRDPNGFLVEAPPLRSGAEQERVDERKDHAERNGGGGGALPALGGAGGGGRGGLDGAGDDDEPPGGGGSGRGGGGEGVASGRARGQRSGGELGPITVASTQGRRKAPVRRAKGARLDEELGRKRSETARLAKELEAMEQTLAEAEKELAALGEAASGESAAKEGAAATAIQAGARGVSGRTRAAELARLRDAVVTMRSEAERRRDELAVRQRELVTKEELHAYYKQHQKREADRVRAAALERKRRLLEEGEVLPEDEENAATLEDASACSIQKIARGRAARHHAKALKASYARAATLIQAGARGMFHRRLVRLVRRRLQAVVRVQTAARGRIARVYCKRAAAQRAQERAASEIARVYRGLSGRIRHARKRMLVEAAKGASLVVDVKHLFPDDLKELAETIAKPLVDSTLPFPPAAVLGLVRILVCILQSEKRGDTVGAISAIGVKQQRSLGALSLGWEDAMRVLRRAQRTLRQCRALAAGPSNRRPRLLYLPREALELMAAYGDDPAMQVAAMRRIGPGAKAAAHLLAWAKDLVAVHDLQRHFLDDLGDVMPGWLARQRKRHAARRNVLVRLAILDRGVAVASDCITACKASGDAWGPAGGARDDLTSLKQVAQRELERGDAEAELCRAKEEDEAKRNLAKDQESVEFEARNLSALKQEYAEKRERAARGGKAEELLLPRLLADIQTTTVQVKEMETRLKLAHVRQGKDAVKRREWFEHPHEVRFKAALLGEADALLRIATNERKFLVDAAGGEVYVGGLRGKAAGDMAAATARLEAAQARKDECQVAFDIVNKQFEQELLTLFEDERRREAEPGGWAKASPEELLEDAVEDDLEALAEADRQRFFVTKELLEVAPTRPRPLLICLSRDLSAMAKKQCLSYLTTSLPGMFVHVRSNLHHGADVGALQRILSTGQSIVCEVDPGGSAAQRNAFINAIQVAKRALVPSPVCVLALGDPRNRCGELGMEYLGCAEDDLRALADGRMKRTLQAAAEAVHGLGGSTDALAALESLGTLGEPPSRAHAVVLEAAVILMTPTNRFRGPSEAVAGMAWAACRLLLADPVDFVQRLREVDPYTIPAANLDVLHAYIGAQPSVQRGQNQSSNGGPQGNSNHGGGGGGSSASVGGLSNSGAYLGSGYDTDAFGSGGPGPAGDKRRAAAAALFTAWPPPGSAHRDMQQSPVLARLIAWVEACVSFADELATKGGPPKPITKRTPPGLFSAVVSVRDAETRMGEDNELSSRGWQAACVSLLAPALEDMRVHREAVKLSGVLHTVNVYRDCHRVFFSAYDPTTSLNRSTSVSISQVNKLLKPNSIEASEFGAKGAPTTTEALYHRLVELLALEPVRTVTSSSDKSGGAAAATGGTKKPMQLVCRRRLTLLLRETRRVSGHLATVTLYEESRGELRAHMYLPEYAAAIELDCGGHALRDLFPKADPHWEQPHLASQDAMRLLHPVADRLEIRPSAAEVRDMGVVPRPPPGLDPAGAATLARSQGFTGALRAQGGPGRLLCRRLCYVSGVEHVMTIREFGRRGMLRVRLFEPLSAVERELRLSSTQRVALLDSDTPDEWRVWVPKLDARLSLKKRASGAFGLHLSQLVGRTAQRLSNSPLIVGILVFLDDGDGTGNGLRIALQVPSSQAEFSFTLTSGEVGNLLNWYSTPDPIKDCLCCGAPVPPSTSAYAAQSPFVDESGGNGGTSSRKAKGRGGHHALMMQRRQQLKLLLSHLHYDEGSAQVVLATSGSVTTSTTSRTDLDTGRVIVTTHVTDVIGEAAPMGGWVKRCSAMARPLDLESDPPPPTEGFGKQQPAPVRSGSYEDVQRARKQPKCVKHVHKPDHSGAYVWRPLPPPPPPSSGGGGVTGRLTPDDALGDFGSGGGSGPGKSGSGGTMPDGYRRVMVEFNDLAVPTTQGADQVVLDKHGDAAMEGTLPPDDRGASALAAAMHEEGKAAAEPVNRSLAPKPKKFAVWLAPGQSNALAPEEGEREMFNQAVKVHVGEIAELAYESTMVVKVFESFSRGLDQVQRSLRFAVYNPATSCAESVTLVGDVALREAVGAQAQHLFGPPSRGGGEGSGGKEAEMLYHIVRWRMTLVSGIWSEDLDRYEPRGDRFTVVVKRDRLYASHKETPLGASGGLTGGQQPIGGDGAANMDKLIDDATRRGIKILRQGVSVDGVLLHLTCFELPDAAHPASSSGAAAAASGAPDGGGSGGDAWGEVPPAEFGDDEDDPLPPTLRYVGYNPKNGHKSLLVVPPEAVLEVLSQSGDGRLGDLSLAEMLTSRRRLQLAKVLAKQLRLEYPRNAPPELVLPWSGANVGFLGDVAAPRDVNSSAGPDDDGDGEEAESGQGGIGGKPGLPRKGRVGKGPSGRLPEERVFGRQNRILRTSMQLCKLNLVVSAFRVGGGGAAAAGGGGGGGGGNDLSLNLYYPRIQESCEVVVSAVQMAESLGRSVFDLDPGEPWATAVEWLCRRLKISVDDDPLNPGRKYLRAELAPSSQPAWVAAYQQLDPSVPVAPERVEGVPLKFVPANTRGDLVLRKGCKVKGATLAQRGVAEVLVSIYSRAPGEAAGHGLVIEAYDASSAYTSVLHVAASELRRQVAGRDDLLEPDVVKDTVESLLYRLTLQPSPVGGLSLGLDIKLMPNLFDA